MKISFYAIMIKCERMIALDRSVIIIMKIKMIYGTHHAKYKH